MKWWPWRRKPSRAQQLAEQAAEEARQARAATHHMRLHPPAELPASELVARIADMFGPPP